MKPRRMGLANTVAAENLTAKILPCKIWHSGTRNDGMTVIENVQCIHETPRAILVVINPKEVWIPRAVLRSDSQVLHAGDVGNLAIERYFFNRDLYFLDKALRA